MKKVFFLYLIILSTLLSHDLAFGVPLTGFLDFIDYKNNQLVVYGWAADIDGKIPVKKVQIFVDGKPIGFAQLKIKRADVAINLKRPDWEYSGWGFTVKMKLKKGPHEIYAIAFNSDNKKIQLTNLNNNKSFKVK